MSKDIEAILAEIEKIKKEEYQRGYKAGRASVADELIKLGQQLQQTSNSTGFIRARTRSSQQTPNSRLVNQPGYRPGTTIAKVHKFIQNNPGHTGAEIYAMLKRDDETVEERTVRTSLNRLKSKWGKLIENREGKWYPKKEADLFS